MTDTSVRVLIVVHGLDPEACHYMLTVQGPWTHDLCIAVGHLFGAILMRVQP